MPDTTSMIAIAAATIHRIDQNACRKIAHATLLRVPFRRASPWCGPGPTVLAIPPGYRPVPSGAVHAPAWPRPGGAVYAAAQVP